MFRLRTLFGLLLIMNTGVRADLTPCEQDPHALCQPPDFTEWEYRLCDDAGPYLRTLELPRFSGRFNIWGLSPALVLGMLSLEIDR